MSRQHSDNGVKTFWFICVLTLWIGFLSPGVLASLGLAVPIPGWLSGGMLVLISGFLLSIGWPIRQYMKENQERAAKETFGPRKYQLDLPTAFRIVMFARACWFAGGGTAGIFGGLLAYLLIFAQADLVSGILPTVFAISGAAILAFCGYLVQSWGKLPPSEGGGTALKNAAPNS